MAEELILHRKLIVKKDTIFRYRMVMHCIKCKCALCVL